MSEPALVAATWEPIDSLTPWDRNPRVNDHAAEDVARSIKRFGWGAVLLARTEDRRCVAGHTRLKAIPILTVWYEKEKDDSERLAAWHPEAIKVVTERVVPTRLMDLTDAQAKQLALADNKLGEIAAWDDEALAAILRELDSSGDDVLATGFSQPEVDVLLGAWADPFAGEQPRSVIFDESIRTVKVRVKLELAQRARGIVEAALKQAGIEVEITGP